MGAYKLSASGSFATSRTQYKSFLTGNAYFVPWLPSPSYDSIASGVGTGGGITFSSIPQTYRHLQLRLKVKSTTANPDYFAMRFNGVDTGGNYYGHWLYGNGASALASAPSPTANTTAIILGDIPGTTATNVVGTFVIDIFDYTSTNKNKTTRSLGGYDANGSGTVSLISGLALSTSAITSITLLCYNGAMGTDTSYALYGVR